MAPFLAGKGVSWQGGMGGDRSFPTVTSPPWNSPRVLFQQFAQDFHAHCCSPAWSPVPPQFLGWEKGTLDCLVTPCHQIPRQRQASEERPGEVQPFSDSG